MVGPDLPHRSRHAGARAPSGARMEAAGPAEADRGGPRPGRLGRAGRSRRDAAQLRDRYGAGAPRAVTSSTVLATSQDTAAAVISMVAIVLGFAVCGVLWWLMVLRPSRAERAQREKERK